MDQLGERIKHIINELKDYVETRLELVIVNISDKVTLKIGQSIQKLLGFSLLAIGLLFALVALAIFLGELFDQRSLGYVIVSAPLLLIGVFFAFGKPRAIARGIQESLMEEIIEALEDKIEEIPPNKKKELAEKNVRE
ncbi:MAG: phage holin family protein [Balneolaceae bacterium]